MAQITAKPNLTEKSGTVDVQCGNDPIYGMPINVSLTPAEVDRFIADLMKARNAARAHTNQPRPFWK